MLINGKVKKIVKQYPDKDIYIVVLHKNRRGKPIEIAIIFWGKLSNTIAENHIKVDERIDVQVYAYSKSQINKGKEYFNTYLVAESWRHYVKGKERFREIANPKTGEVIKRKNEIENETF